MIHAKVFANLLLVLVYAKLNAQTFSKSDFIGKWNVDSIASIKLYRPVPKNELPEMERQKAKFKNSVFVFMDDGFFSLQASEKNEVIQEAFWEVNDESNVTIIRIWKNKSKNGKELFVILPNKKNDKIEFCIDSTIHRLIMSKFSNS